MNGLLFLAVLVGLAIGYAGVGAVVTRAVFWFDPSWPRDHDEVMRMVFGWPILLLVFAIALVAVGLGDGLPFLLRRLGRLAGAR